MVTGLNFWPSPENGEGLWRARFPAGLHHHQLGEKPQRTLSTSAVCQQAENGAAIQDLKYNKGSLLEAEYNKSLEGCWFNCSNQPEDQEARKK